MTPVLNLLEERMRSLFVERRMFHRRHANFPVSLPVGVSIPNENLDPEAEEYPNPIMGRTRDLSEKGLSLILPSLGLGQEQITDQNFPLRIVLSLPGGVIIVQAFAVRVEMTNTPEGEPGYIVGARIRHINERDHKLYLTVFRKLG